MTVSQEKTSAAGAVASGSFQVPEGLLKGSSGFRAEYFDLKTLSSEAFAKALHRAYENPFAPVPKPEKLMGKVVDFTASVSGPAGAQRRGGRRGSVHDGPEDATSAGLLEEEEWTVMAEPSKPSGAYTTGGMPARRGGRGAYRGGMRGGANNYGRRRPGFGNRVIKEPSVHVEADWALLDEIEFTRLAKLSYMPISEPSNPVVVDENDASVPAFQSASFRTLSAKSERALGALDIVPTVPVRAVDDAKLLALAKEHGASVATTDLAITALMACSRSVLPWDILSVTRDGVLVVDLRAGWMALDTPSVNENAYEPPIADKDHINGAVNLSAELARVNAKLPTFLAGTSAPTDAGHRYCLWDLEDGLKMVVRCQANYRDVDSGVVGLVNAVLEYEPGKTGDWRSRLDAQRAAVLATEAKNNAAMLSRWIYAAVLADAAIFKLAFVSRLGPKERTRHALLGFHEADPYDAARQFGIDVANGFGILKAMLKQFLAYGVDKSLAIMKDPNKPLLRVYSTPSINHNQDSTTTQPTQD